MKTIKGITIVLIFLLILIPSRAEKENSQLKEGKRLPSFSITEGKVTKVFPNDLKGKTFALYLGNIETNHDGYEFLSWGGAFTIALRQSDEFLFDTYFTGIASLKHRPLYWVPMIVKKTFHDEMKKNDVRGEIFFEFDGKIAEKFGIERNGVRAIVVDKKGIVRKIYNQSVYDLSEDDQEDLYQLLSTLVLEE